MRASTVIYALSMSLMALAAPVKRVSDNTKTAFQFAHVLEQLETQFYAQALKAFQASDFTTAGFNNPQLVVDQLTFIANDEATHTTVLEQSILALGAQPISDCSFDFSSVLKDLTTTINVARLVEHVGVAAYLGAAALIDDTELLTAAASILTVEARHSTIHNLLAGGTSVPSAFDLALSPQQVLAIAGPFISGCTLPITANAVLSATNTGPVTVGTQLQLASPALNDTSAAANFTCQMMVGGAQASIAQPLNNCIVPDGIDGLVFVYVTKTNQPLLNDLTVQFQADIVAGPLGVFIDTKSDLLAELISSKAIGGNPAFVSNGGSGGGSGGNDTSSTPPPPPSSGSPSNPSSDPTTTTATDSNGGASTFTATSTIPASVASSILASATASSSAPATTQTGTPGTANLVTGDVSGAIVIGWSEIPAVPTATAPARRSVKLSRKNRL